MTEIVSFKHARQERIGLAREAWQDGGMPKRPSRKKAAAPAQTAKPQDVQAKSDQRTAEQLRGFSVKHIVGKFQGRKSI
jgi:hypothetical protein